VHDEGQFPISTTVKSPAELPQATAERLFGMAAPVVSIKALQAQVGSKKWRQAATGQARKLHCLGVALPCHAARLPVGALSCFAASRPASGLRCRRLVGFGQHGRYASWHVSSSLYGFHHHGLIKTQLHLGMFAGKSQNAALRKVLAQAAKELSTTGEPCCCVCGTGGEPSVSSETEEDEGHTLRFTAFTTTSFAERTIRLHKAGVSPGLQRKRRLSKAQAIPARVPGNQAAQCVVLMPDSTCRTVSVTITAPADCHQNRAAG
jgi:hypothetical protein